MTLRTAAKATAFTLATVAVLPALVSFHVRSLLLGPDRALQGSSQALSLVPGLLGQYLRRAFFSRVLAHCGRGVVIEFGAIFSKVGARLEENAYVGPRCHIGLAHVERDVMLAAGVHVPSGARTHGTDDLEVPMREQPGERSVVRIGAGAWVGSNAVVLADVGRGAIVGAGAVVTAPVPEMAVVAGVPAKVIRSRQPADRVPVEVKPVAGRPAPLPEVLS
jgi:virginiamycin A acetyltransferase